MSFNSSPCPHCTLIARDEGHTYQSYRGPCPSTGEGHGVDVDGCLLLRAGPRILVPLSIQLDIQVPRVAHTHEAPGFECEREPPPPGAWIRVRKQASTPHQKIGPRRAANWRSASSTRTTIKPENTPGDISRFFPPLSRGGDQGVQRSLVGVSLRRFRR